MLWPGSKKDKTQVVVSISNRTVLRVIILVVVAMLGLAALKKAEHTLVLIFTAFFLSVALNSPVHALAQHLPGKRRGSRPLATSLSFLVVVILLGAFLSSIVPPLVRQTNNFISAAPGLIEEVKSQNGSVGQFVRRYKLQSEVQNFSSELNQRLKNVGGTAVSTVSDVGSSIFSLLAVLVLTFMMLVEGPRWAKLLIEIIPSDYHEHTNELARSMYKVVQGFVNGQVTLAFIASVLIVPMLFILNINYPLALMVVIFVCGLIPLVGHTLGAIIVSLVALFTSPFAAVIILAYYLLYQQIETYLIQPKIQANSTALSPLLVFMSVIIGVNFGGLFGGLVAIPLTGCIRILVLDYLRRRHILEATATD